jgi:hypothetical protein
MPAALRSDFSPVSVTRSAQGWTCGCVCGWSSRRLRLPTQDAAGQAAAMHVRVCPFLSR